MFSGDVPRIFVGVHGSIGSLRALRRAVAETRQRDGVLYSVIAWSPPGGEAMDRRAPEPHLWHNWHATAQHALRDAWDRAFGGVPEDLPVRLIVERGAPGWVLTELADSQDDLIVIGSGRCNPVRRVLRPSISRYCVARANCPVLVVPSSPLDRQAGHRHRWEMSDLLENNR